MTHMTKMTKEIRSSISSTKLARIRTRVVLRISVSMSNEILRDLVLDPDLGPGHDHHPIEMTGIEEIERKNQGIEDLVAVIAVKVPYREIQETNQEEKDLIGTIMREGRGKAPRIQRAIKR